jgi:prophage regulatory protein
MTNTDSIRIIRKPEALNQLGLSKSTLYVRINDGLLPPPISLGGRAVGFLEHEIQTIIAARAAGNDNDKIKTVVTQLVEQRNRVA